MTAALLREAAQTLREKAERVRRPYGPDERYDLEVAELLTRAADHADGIGKPCGSCHGQALAVARAVLRRES